MITQVQEILRTADLSRTSRNTVATALCICGSTFGRRLGAEGVTFSELLKQEQRRRCKELLAMNPHAGGDAIKKRCGLNQVNSAYRLFKSLFGVSLYEVKFKGASI